MRHFFVVEKNHLREFLFSETAAFPHHVSSIIRSLPASIQRHLARLLNRRSIRRLRRYAPIVRGLGHTSEKVCPNHMAKGNPVLLVSARLNGLYLLPYLPVDRLVLRCSYHFKHFVLAKNFIPAYAHLWRMHSAASVPTIHAQRRSRAEVVPPDVATLCEWHRIYLLFLILIDDAI